MSEQTTDFDDYPNPYDFATQAEWQEAMRKVNEKRRSETTDGVTGEQMCQAIVKADFLRKPDGTAPTAEEIWCYSPSGELYMVFCWYLAAKAILSGRLTNPDFAAITREVAQT